MELKDSKYMAEFQEKMQLLPARSQPVLTMNY